MNELQKLPAFREDVVYQKIENNGTEYLFLSDPKGYVLENLIFPMEMLDFLRFLNGDTTLNDLEEALKLGAGVDQIDLSPFTNLIEHLDNLGYLETPHFQALKTDWDNYNNSQVRPSICAGSSYPDNPIELKNMLKSMQDKVSEKLENTQAKSIIVPHIDFRVGAGAASCYTLGYESICDTDADVYIIFGTSHHVSSADFMFTRKNYSTPLGICETDHELLSELEKEFKNTNSKLIYDEKAHRFEHSIEFQIVWLQYMFPNKNFKVLPILCGSLGNFMSGNKLPIEDNKFKSEIDSIIKSISNLNRKPVFIAGADFAHIGRKFEDDYDAEPMLPNLAIQDDILLKHLENCDSASFFRSISNCQDKNKICGLSPIYSLLCVSNPIKSDGVSGLKINATTKIEITHKIILCFRLRKTTNNKGRIR